jgi:hypothetical protein
MAEDSVTKRRDKTVKHLALREARDSMCMGCMIGMPDSPEDCIYEQPNAPDGSHCFAEPIRALILEEKNA